MFPSSFGDMGSDVIDATVENTFSMAINGNSTIGSYQLKIYTNTDANTLVYDSGVTALSSPFISTLSNGTKVRFEVDVPSNDSGVTPHTAMVNEYADGYKWTITLWETYDSEDPTSTRIISDENFIKTKTPSILTIDATTAPATITSRSNEWKAIFNSSSSIMQFKWTIYEVVDGAYVFLDETDWIFQALQVWFSYDGLVSGKTYAVQAQVVTQDGVTCQTELATSAVSYTTLVVSGATQVELVEGGLSTTMAGIQYIEGEPLLLVGDTASTNYTIVSDYLGSGLPALQIGSDTYVQFASSATFSLDLDDDSVYVWCFHPQAYTGAEISILRCASDDAVQLRTLKHESFVAGLVPNGDSLVPNGDSLVPSGGDNGRFVYTINGTSYYAYNGELPTHKYIVVMTDSSFAIYEYNAGGDA